MQACAAVKRASSAMMSAFFVGPASSTVMLSRVMSTVSTNAKGVALTAKANPDLLGSLPSTTTRGSANMTTQNMTARFPHQIRAATSTRLASNDQRRSRIGRRCATGFEGTASGADEDNG